jgi:zinc transport system substrate-binding protein
MKITVRDCLSVGLLWAALSAPWIGSVGQCTETMHGGGNRIKVLVSILPQAYFLERVGGNRVDISVMVGPGQSPATYELRPRQMADISTARLYFRIGVPFESVWLPRVGAVNPALKVIDTGRGIERMPMKSRHHEDRENGGAEKEATHKGGMRDPHIWLSLRLVKVQAENICKALIEEDPPGRAYYEENLKIFLRDLDRADREISQTLSRVKTGKFMVFHPVWGYFARDYGLEQVSIEVEGKEPNAKDLARLIKEAKEEGITVVFVQKQFSRQSAEAVARAIGGRVVEVDPLTMDYLDNMRKVGEAFREVMQ